MYIYYIVIVCDHETTQAMQFAKKYFCVLASTEIYETLLNF